MIKLQIVGNLGGDCIVKDVNGKTVINFNVAHTDKYKDAQGNAKERTTWVNCAYWTDRTTVAEYLKKGKQVYAEGAPEADGYTNKDGQVAATLRMRVQSLQLLGGNDNNHQQNAGNPISSNYQQSGGGYQQQHVKPISSGAASHASVADMSLDDDLPF